MSNEVEKFDPSTLMEGIKNRIKATFVALIPDDKWEDMCKKVIDDFFYLKHRFSHRENYESDFEKIARTILTEWTKSQINFYLSEYNINNYEPKISEKLKEFVTENAPKILENLLYGMVSAAKNDLQNCVNRSW